MEGLLALGDLLSCFSYGVVVGCIYMCVCAAGDTLCLQESDCYRSQNELAVRELNDSKIPLFDVPVSL